MFIIKTLPDLEDITIVETKNKAKKILPQTLQIEKLQELNTITNSYKLLKKFKFKEIEDIPKQIEKLDLNLKEFKIICKRIGKHKFSSQDIREIVTKILCEKYKTEPNYKEPKNEIFIDIVNNNCLIGLEPKIDLCKRQYKVRTSNNSLNSCLASTLLIIADYDPKQPLLDPFCSDGVIAIEAALKKGKVNAFDPKQTNLFNAKLNSQVANVKINFEIKESPQIITQIPFISKRSNPRVIEKQLIGFLELTKAAKSITVITQKTILLEKLMENYPLKISKKRKVLIGEQKYVILWIKKKTN
ncbi:MAG: THUMP domain-containing protein [Nanoarchaeota archaeon]